MLGIDYTTKLDQLIESVDWNIELPAEWSGYFQQRGEQSTYAEDERNNQRLKIRTYGILYFDQSLHFRTRSQEPMGVYTRDFSRQGAGFLAPVELFPEERVRIALSTFWVQLKVVRTRRITAACFEIGTVLVKRHDPGNEAFAILQPACI